MTFFEVEFPFRLQHHADTRGSWRGKAAAARKIRGAVAFNLMRFGKQRPKIPCRVTMIRGAPRRLDDDNNVHAFKHCRDQIAHWLGVNDRRDDLVEYVCKQHQTRPGVYYVRITFENKEPGDAHDTPTTAA